MMINNPLSLRPARSSDGEPIIGWCNQLWNGQEDYIGEVWDAWLAEGNLFVGTLPPDDTPVGLLRMRMLSASEAWFGGLRIHPDLHGRGGGRQLINIAVEWARGRGATSLGYMTETANERMHYLGAAMEFSRIGSMTWMRLRSTSLAAAATPGQHTADAIDLAHAPNLAAQNGRYVSDWTVRRLSRERLEEHAACGELLINAAASAWIILEPDQPQAKYLTHAEGSADGIRGLLAHAFTQPGAEEGILSPAWDGSPLQRIAAEIGFGDDQQYYSLFERPV